MGEFLVDDDGLVKYEIRLPALTFPEIPSLLNCQRCSASAVSQRAGNMQTGLASSVTPSLQLHSPATTIIKLVRSSSYELIPRPRPTQPPQKYMVI